MILETASPNYLLLNCICCPLQICRAEFSHYVILHRPDSSDFLKKAWRYDLRCHAHCDWLLCFTLWEQHLTVIAGIHRDGLCTHETWHSVFINALTWLKQDIKSADADCRFHKRGKAFFSLSVFAVFGCNESSNSNSSSNIWYYVKSKCLLLFAFFTKSDIQKLYLWAFILKRKCMRGCRGSGGNARC